ncbi:MAG: tRNA preQ1(34) S-adenosylmethionine ribosyltransferase-isomerase QueA [Deltaproteobacteria bacterium]|nr:tRNA preQ1(34) S-adenosylmethionine ribosyltransferase-isomerase QueA [Deltaproteobacteria bacterium]
MLSLYQYSYPKTLITQHPLPQRDQSRMMVVDRGRRAWDHRAIRDLPAILRPGDLLVFNDTRVFPARLLGKDQKIEILLLGKNGAGWKALGKPFKKIAEGMHIDFGLGLKGTVVGKNGDGLEIRFNNEALLEKAGLPPLPPYIRRNPEPADRERYQSIFAKNTGSAAAPTASFHFTEELVKKLKASGVETAFVTLHVSRDTFLPIRTDEVKQHKMHGERFFVPKETQTKIKQAKGEGRRVIAVGTTVVRALESDWSQSETKLFITPGFQFKIVDALLTNFHQPASTLLLMVSAFAGRELILNAYQEAIAHQYRLFSYGDSMLIF